MEILGSIGSAGHSVLVYLVPFLFVLMVVVFVHEMGHYLVGRLCGIGVQAFSVGFGPELVGFNDRHGTRWKLCAIPLGGYVKFVGDMSVTSSQADAQATAALSEAERRISFHTQPVWKRAATVFAGPLFNFLLTIVVFAVLFVAYGRYVSEPVVAEVTAGSPAEEAGIRPGDRFVSVDGSKVESFSDVQRLVSGRAGDAITFVLLRDGKDVTVTATPRPMEQEDALGNKIKVAVIGVVNNQEAGQPRLVTYGPGGALVAAASPVWLPATETLCQTSAGSSTASCDPAAPITVTSYEYGASGTADNLLLRGLVVTSAGVSLRTCYGYDEYGNKIFETKPRAGLASCS